MPNLGFLTTPSKNSRMMNSHEVTAILAFTDFLQAACCCCRIVPSSLPAQRGQWFVGRPGYNVHFACFPEDEVGWGIAIFGYQMVGSTVWVLLWVWAGLKMSQAELKQLGFQVHACISDFGCFVVALCWHVGI